MKTHRKHWSWISGILILSLSLLFISFPSRNSEAAEGDSPECEQAQCFLGVLFDLLRLQNAITKPVGPNQPVEWSQGPDTPDLPPDERPPNIIVILADDMGFNDVSYYNGGAADGSLQTPGIDSIATQGVVFSNGYASHATCAPSRAAIMTGRYPTRFGYEFTPMPDGTANIFELMNKCNTDPLPTDVYADIANSNPPAREQGVPSSEIFISEKLKEVGYHTVHIGKWHLGNADEMRPQDKGFDESLAMAGPLYLPEDSPDVVNDYTEFSPLIRRQWETGTYASVFNGGQRFEPNGYVTDYYSDEAVKVIDANRNRPFFLFLAHWGVHSPLQAKREDYDALSHITDHRLRVYAAMILALDRGVGRVMDALVQNGIDNNTLVIFTSDNGGAATIGLPDINDPYRGFKATFFEGGTHVPYFMRWPKMITGGMTYSHPISHLDIFATAAAAAGVSLPTDRPMDSVDLLPYVTGVNPDVPHQTLFWRNGYYQVVLSRDSGTGEFWKMQVSDRPDKVWLYNLTTDPTEQANVAASNSAKVTELQALLDAYNAEQVDPLWESFIEGPFRIDKTFADEMLETDEHVYWMN
jgi:arylsulfatase A-like enzyme